MSTRRTFLSQALLAALMPASTRHWHPFSSSQATPSRPASLPEAVGPTILLYSGWQVINIGDIGHTPGTLRYLEEHLPQARVILWLRRTTDAITRMIQQRFPAVQVVEGTLDAAGKASTTALQQAFDGCEWFVYNSGMHYNQFWNPPIGLIQACEAYGKKLCLYAQSFDGFAKEDEAEMSDWLSKARLIYTRDTDSMYYLRSIGVKSPVLEFGPDGCFGIDLRDDERAAAFLSAHGLAPRSYLTVTLRTNSPKMNAAGDVLNPKDPTEAERAENESWAGRLREVITDWVRRTGKQVVLAPEVNKEIHQARVLIYEQLPASVRQHLVLRETFWNVDEAASVYAQACAVLSMEPHSGIIALAHGTPALHYFSRKHGLKAWMFRDIGLAEWLFDIDATPATSVQRALAAIEEDPLRARNKVRRAMEGVHARSAEMMADLRAWSQ